MGNRCAMLANLYQFGRYGSAFGERRHVSLRVFYVHVRRDMEMYLHHNECIPVLDFITEMESWQNG